MEALVARIVRCYWGGDHSLFLGQVEYVRYGDGTPLLFHSGRYERVVQEPHVFSGLPDDLLQPIHASGVERSYADGETIMRRGEPGNTLCLVAEGTVQVERPGRSVQLGAGELIGEIEELNPGGGRIADITAVGRVRCLQIARADLVRALEANPRRRPRADRGARNRLPRDVGPERTSPGVRHHGGNALHRPMDSAYSGHDPVSDTVTES